MLIYTASPDSQHILIPIYQQLDPGSVPLRSDLCQEVVGRDPITTTAEYPYAVDFE
jgi:hypothetical protein